MKTKVIIADDHAVVRNGLKTLLAHESTIEIIGEAINGFDTIDKVMILQPDVLLLDITMPDISGIEVARIVSGKYPAIKILIFSMHANTEYILNAIENGAKGYLLKDSDKEEILKAIKVVSKGKKYFPADVSEIIIDELLLKNRKNNKPSTENKAVIFGMISPKERQILEHIILGKSSREIAEKLNLSIRTVDNHRASIMKKTKAKNTADLVKMAVGE